MHDDEQMDEFTRLDPQACMGRSVHAPVDEGLAETLARFNATVAPRVPPRYRQRFMKSLAYVRWLIRSSLGDTPIRALEIGCGEGPKGLALADICESYEGIDISPHHIRRAQNFSGLMGIPNIQFEVCEANDTPGFLAGRKGRYNLVILYAVLEHLTIEEKLNLLRLCWDYLDEDGILMVGETPNRLLPIDYHSSKLVYFQQMPLEMWKRYMERSPNDAWRTAMELSLEEGDFLKTVSRRGQHVGPQEFDLGIADVESLDRHVVADNYHVSMLNLYPLHPVEVLKLTEFSFLKTFSRGVKIAGRDFPAFFSRYYMEALLRKTPPAVALEKPYFLYPQLDRRASEAGFLGEERRISADQPMILERKDDSPGPLDVCVTINCRSGAGAITVHDAGGSIVFERAVDELARAFGRLKGQATFLVPHVPHARFPLTIGTTKGGEALVRYVVARGTSATA